MIRNRPRLILPLLFLTLSLGACAPRPSPRATETFSVTPIADTTYGGCGYQWAYNDLPELTAQFDQAVKDLIPNSNSHATAFGENCLGNDGQVLKFLAKETDFYVLVSVETVDDYETFGTWIAQVMQVVNDVSTDETNQGFVEFRFEKSPAETIGVRVPIQQYNDSANGITGENLFRMFYIDP